MRTSGMEHVEVTLAVPTSAIAEVLVQLCHEWFGATLRAVVLTGSLARNEISITDRDGQTILLSDAEAMVVLRDSAALPSRNATRALCSLVERQLALRAIGVHVSLSVVYAAYLRRLPPHIYSYELRTCGIVLFGEPAILNEITGFTASDLEPEDAWRLLSNRLVEQMGTSEDYAGCSDADNDNDTALRYRTIKLCLDLASSLLVFSGRFEAGYRARLHCVEQLALSPEAHRLPIPIHEFLPLLRLCTTAKLQAEAAVDFASGFSDQVTRWAWQAWRWELQQITGRDPDTAAKQMICRLGWSHGGNRLMRGWLYAARRNGWLHSMRFWPKWLALLTSGFTPRHAVYLAAYTWQQERGESGDSTRRTQEAVCKLLPVGRANSTPTDVASQLAWNYQEFVMETRA